MASGLVSALRTLSIVPLPGKEVARPFQALPWFVVAGAALGGMQAAFGWALVTTGFTEAVFTGILLAVVNYVSTGGLHLDGLADTVDAFGTIHDRAATLRILKDPHLGTFGAAALVCAILWRIVACQHLLQPYQLVWLVLAPASSRVVQGLLLSRLPYARNHTGKAFGYRAPWAVTVLLAVQLAGVMAVALLWRGSVHALLPFACGALAACLAPLLYLRRLGGITGDCIGAATELYELAFLGAALV